MTERDELATRRIDAAKAANVAEAAAGGLLMVMGFKRGGLIGMATRILGTVIFFRGIRHISPLNEMFPDGPPHNPSDIGSEAIRVEAEADIECDREELFRVWRDLENIPAFMDKVLSVRVLSPTLSHWIVKGPVGTAVNFDAEIINEVPGQLIAWQTIDRTSVVHAGSVHFSPLNDGRTRVRVVMRYDPPAHGVGHAVAAMFGSNPQEDVERFLARFKEIMETGQVPSRAKVL